MAWDPWVYTLAKVVHVFFAATWLGAFLYGQVVVMPLLNRVTPMTRREVTNHLGPKGLKMSNAWGGFTLLSGLFLLEGSLDARGLSWGDFYEDPWGRHVAFALIANLLVLYLINFAVRPTMRALGKITADAPPNEPPPANAAFFHKRIAFTNRLALGILLLGFVAMVVANAQY